MSATQYCLEEFMKKYPAERVLQSMQAHGMEAYLVNRKLFIGKYLIIPWYHRLWLKITRQKRPINPLWVDRSGETITIRRPIPYANINGNTITQSGIEYDHQ